MPAGAPDPPATGALDDDPGVCLGAGAGVGLVTGAGIDPDEAGLVEIRRVEPVMGTVVSLAAWAPAERPDPTEAAVTRALGGLREADDRFTTWRPSEWLRYAAGDLALEDAHPDLRHVVERCRWLEEETDGAFSLTARSGQPADPSAYVKGWAAQQAADLVMAAGATKVCVNCGGDVAVAGGDRPWRIGVQDPFDPQRLRAVVEVERGAVATSGRYARGDHVADPRTAGPATAWASVTVVGPDLGLADAYSTALFASGRDRERWAWFDRLAAYSAYLVDPAGGAETVRFADA